MILTFNEHCVSARSWPSLRELVSFLEAGGGGSLLLGSEAESGSEYHSLAVYPRGAVEGRFGVGVVTQTPELPPHLLLRPERNLLLFGFNSEVVGVGLPERAIRFRHTCDWLFSHFLDAPALGVVLAFYEVGVLALDYDGRELWRRTTDILVDWKLAGETVRLEQMEAGRLVLDLRTGAAG